MSTNLIGVVSRQHLQIPLRNTLPDGGLDPACQSWGAFMRASEANTDGLQVPPIHQLTGIRLRFQSSQHPTPPILVQLPARPPARAPSESESAGVTKSCGSDGVLLPTPIPLTSPPSSSPDGLQVPSNQPAIWPSTSNFPHPSVQPLNP